MRHITEIRVVSLWETCERWTYFVEVTTDEGLKNTLFSFATGSVVDGHAGLSRDTARDQALVMADRWGDYLEITVEPFVEDGVLHEPSMRMMPYTNQREDMAPLY